MRGGLVCAAWCRPPLTRVPAGVDAVAGILLTLAVRIAMSKIYCPFRSVAPRGGMVFELDGRVDSCCLQHGGGDGDDAANDERNAVFPVDHRPPCYRTVTLWLIRKMKL